MADSPQHLFLKNVGKAFLYNQGCYLVDTGVKLNQLGLARFSDMDKHTVVDVCGIGLRYFPHGRRPAILEDIDDLEGTDPESLEYGFNVPSGVEVKASRADLKNGFICSGCNYNYLLTPTRLIAPSDLRRGVGLIEFNKYKFSCELTKDEADGTFRRAFTLKGVTVVRRPRFRTIAQFQIDHAISLMAGRARRRDMEKSMDQIYENIGNHELLYPINGSG